jgi:hypothetical protein
VTVSNCRQSYKSKFHSSCIFSRCRVRGPPSDFSLF